MGSTQSTWDSIDLVFTVFSFFIALFFRFFFNFFKGFFLTFASQ